MKKTFSASKGLFVFIALSVALAAGWVYYNPWAVAGGIHENCQVQQVILQPPPGTDKSAVTVAAELALTDKKRQQGLMYRRSMAPDAGMLFFWEAPQQIVMWMKNTYIPLDMIYINGQEVVGIIEAANTRDTTPLTIPAPADKVLEVNLGFSEARGIEKGWQVRMGPCLD